MYSARNGRNIYPQDPGGPNCKFEIFDKTATIKEAGLCQGAILAQREHLMRD
jgi:hypothetical protein